MRRLLIDTAPLHKDRDFRWLWWGQAVNNIGTHVTRVALPYHVYVLTGSTFAIAALVFFQLIPIVVFVLGAGSVADVLDRRRLLIVTQVGLLVCTLALLLLSLVPETPIIALFGVAFVAAAFYSVDQPTRTSAIPRLVPPERLSAAIALNQLNFKSAAVMGPAFGGVLIGAVGLPGAYAVDAITFAASLVALLAIRPLPPISGALQPGLAAIREGIRFAMSRRVLLSSFAIDLNAMILGTPTAVFPALALDVFRVGPAGLGMLAAAPGLGAFAGALLSGWVSAVTRVGRAIVIAVVVWGVAITAFALSTFSFPVALFFLAVAGAADLFSTVLRSTLIQLATPDELRGRVSAMHTLVVTSGPRLGDMRAASLASVIGAQPSVAIGGILCVLGVAVVLRQFPELPAHRIRDVDGARPPSGN